MRFGIGQPVTRKEDRRFLTGRGRYVADVDLARQTYAVMVFSPHAHARIRGIDKAADYGIPHADTLPAIDIDFSPVPSTTNPLGAKGVGEGGTVASTPTIINAILDALAPLGVTDLPPPSASGARSTATRIARKRYSGTGRAPSRAGVPGHRPGMVHPCN